MESLGVVVARGAQTSFFESLCRQCTRLVREFRPERLSATPTIWSKPRSHGGAWRQAG